MHGPLQYLPLSKAARRGNVFVAGLARVQPKASTRLNSCESSHPARPAFTLVELLITITIIGLLSAVVLGALQSARETAKAAKTKSTITKLHYTIMARYDSYRTRRVPVDTKGMNPRVAATARLAVLRDLMRMEMPDRWSDVVLDHASSTPIKEIPLATGLTRPAISDRFYRLYCDAVSQHGVATVGRYSSAECLYMIVMSIPEAAEQFSGTEIGDFDGDGLPEFIDGWGRPIKFIRWPVGFVDYDRLAALQSPNGPAGSVNGPELRWDSPSDLQSGNRQEQPDPFDNMGIGGGWSVQQENPPGTGPGYAVFPLVFSAGSDGIFDINTGFGFSGSYVFTHLDYFEPDGNRGADSDGKTLRYIGQPRDADVEDGSPKNNELNHYDNIHNHMLEVR